jgi:diguanylate cyclase (GGDEF)-like protein
MHKQSILKYIFILSCLVALAYPLVHIWVIFPAYQNILIQYTEDDAVRVASHISSSLSIGEHGFTRESLPADIAEMMARLSRDFRIEKVKIFSPAGEVIFSSEYDEWGVINNHPYFQEKVRAGHNFTKLVARNEKTLEGRVVTQDVVETYVPIIIGGNFAGALEIYYDISTRSQTLKSTALLFSALPFGLILCFLLAIVGIVITAKSHGQIPLQLPSRIFSPGYLLFYSMMTIFAAETIVMVLISAMPPIGLPHQVVLDATLLVMLIAPGIYFFFLKPLFAYMAEQKRVEQKLGELSVTDELTGLLNRRGFFAHAESLLATANRVRSSVILLFADLNDLKSINDTFGHPRGDQVVQELAAILKETFRDSDVIARMGGDEFAVCLLNTDGDGAVEIVARRLHDSVLAHNRKNGNCQLSVSVGVSIGRPGEEFSVESLLSLADKLMYQNKEEYKACSGGKAPWHHQN